MQTMLVLPIALLLALSVPALAQNPNNNGNHGQGNNGNHGQGNTAMATADTWCSRSPRGCGPSPTSDWRRHLLDCTPPKKRSLISYNSTQGRWNGCSPASSRKPTCGLVRGQ